MKTSTLAAAAAMLIAISAAPLSFAEDTYDYQAFTSAATNVMPKARAGMARDAKTSTIDHDKQWKETLDSMSR